MRTEGFSILLCETNGLSHVNHYMCRNQHATDGLLDANTESCLWYVSDTDAPIRLSIDFDYKTTDGRDADKVILLSWIPDTAKIKQKMSYAGTKEAVKSALVGVALNINATDLAEAGMDALTEACNKV